MAIVDATRRLARTGIEISMPAVAREALLSEATAYRYFPDLASLLQEADEGGWPDPAGALAPVADSEMVERVSYTADSCCAGHPAPPGRYSGHDLRLDHQAARRGRQARAPVQPSTTRSPQSPARWPGPTPGLAQLRRDLAVVISAPKRCSR